MAKALTRKEKYLSAIAGETTNIPEPLKRDEFYLAKAAGMDVKTPEPLTRSEAFLKKALSAGTGGGGGASSEDVEYLKGLVAKTITEIDDTMFDTLGNEMFKGQNQLISAKFNIVTSMGYSVFESCSNLVSLELPELVSCETMSDMDGMYGLFDSSRIAYSASSLVAFKAPKLEAVLPKEFAYCSALVDVDISGATSIGIYSFNYCKNLVKIDLPKVTRIDQVAFNGCARLTAVILRSEEVVTLVNANAFNGCHHIHGTTDPMDSTANPEGLKDGYFYVPAALVEEYDTDAVWSTFAGQFRALENYTVDGTITGELDESKVLALTL